MTAAGNGQLEAVNMKALLISVGQQPESKGKSMQVETNDKDAPIITNWVSLFTGNLLEVYPYNIRVRSWLFEIYMSPNLEIDE